MNDVKLNEMRELNLNEIGQVSGGCCCSCSCDDGGTTIIIKDDGTIIIR